MLRYRIAALLVERLFYTASWEGFVVFVPVKFKMTLILTILWFCHRNVTGEERSGFRNIVKRLATSWICITRPHLPLAV